MSTQSLPSSGRVRATSGGHCRAIRPASAGTADPKLAITELIRSMEAEIRAILTDAVSEPGDVPGLLDAICRAHGAALATRNIKDFPETGVEVIDPWRSR